MYSESRYQVDGIIDTNASPLIGDFRGVFIIDIALHLYNRIVLDTCRY